MSKQRAQGRPAVVAKWTDDKRWQPIPRYEAAAMLRANRRHGARVYRCDGALHIEGRGVHFVITRATGAES